MLGNNLNIGYDYSLLKARIVVRCGYKKVAEELGLSDAQLRHRLNNVKPFDTLEIEKLVNLLDIGNDEIGNYFFQRKVKMPQTN